MLEDGRLAQAPAKSRPQTVKPSRPVSNGHGSNNPAARMAPSQVRVGSGNRAAVNKSKPSTAMPRKIDISRNGFGRPIVQKPLPSKVHVQTTGPSKPPIKGSMDRPSTSSAHSAQKNYYADQKKPSLNPNNIRPTLKMPVPSSKSQETPSRGNHEERPKKKPMKRRLGDDDDEDAIGMIRKMFGYNPAKYSGVDDDVSDMEADFREIQMEERRSAKIAKKEDEEQLRLIEEEERRERMRKKKL